MFRKTLTSSVVAGALVLGGVNAAQADAVGTAYLNVYNFLFSSGGTKLNVGTDLLFVNNQLPNNDGDTAANLNGTAEGFEKTAQVGLVLDVDTACVGACTGLEPNTFNYVQSGQPAPATYAVGDVLLTGSVVNIGGAALPNADAKLLAEVSLENGPAAFGTSAGNNAGVDAGVVFQAGFSGNLDISFTADLFLRALLTADETGTVANATSSFNITLVQLTGAGAGTTQRFNTFDLNQTRSASVPGTDIEESFTKNFSQTFGVINGEEYQVTIRGITDANATIEQTVPVPATLGLFGLGLVGLGFIRRRTQAS